jgi:hypothetical protein
MLGGTTNRPTNKLPPGYGQEPVIMDGDGGMRPPGYPPQTGGTTPLPFEGSDPVMFGPRGPHRIKNPPPTQNNDLGYIGGTPDFDETTGTYRDGRDTPGMMGTYDGRGPLLSADGPRSDYDPQQQMSRPSRQNRPLGGRYNGFGQQQQNPFMGGGGFGGFGGMGGYGQQMQNPFMGGGGFGGFGQQTQNRSMQQQQPMQLPIQQPQQQQQPMGYQGGAF